MFTLLEEFFIFCCKQLLLEQNRFFSITQLPYKWYYWFGTMLSKYTCCRRQTIDRTYVSIASVNVNNSKYMAPTFWSFINFFLLCNKEIIILVPYILLYWNCQMLSLHTFCLRFGLLQMTTSGDTRSIYCTTDVWLENLIYTHIQSYNRFLFLQVFRKASISYYSAKLVINLVTIIRVQNCSNYFSYH